jgi:predicted DNA-binding transcriptional regulator AlpA
MQTEFDRRVYRREFETLLGCGTTWFGELVKRGLIPPGRVDPGARRVWWPASEVRATLNKMAKTAERAKPAQESAAA